MRCPRCHADLKRTETPAGYHWFCPGCHGRAVTLPVLRKAVEKGFVSGCVSAVWAKADAPGTGCPVCHKTMREVAASGHERLMRVDVCFGCQLVWFDAQEFESVPAAPPRPKETMLGVPEPNPHASQAVREAVALARVQSMADQARDGSPDADWKTLPAFFGFPVETDTDELRRKPLATWGLSAVIITASLLAMTRLEMVVDALGLVPDEWWRGGGITLLTSFFLHGGVLHLVSNLYFLLVFGDNVEDFLGRKRYLLLLLAATMAGDVTHILGDPRGTVPCIGASGGVSGVLAFYALRFPEAKVSMLYWSRWSGWGLNWIELPALWLFLLWVLLQSIGVMQQLSGYGNVSSLAHLGGAAAGFALWLFWRKDE